MGFVTSLCCCTGPPADCFVVRSIPSTGVPFNSYVERTPTADHRGYVTYDPHDDWTLQFDPIETSPGVFGLPRATYHIRQAGDGTLWGLVDLRRATTGSFLGAAYFVADTATFNAPAMLHFVKITNHLQNFWQQSIAHQTLLFSSYTSDWAHEFQLLSTGFRHTYLEYGDADLTITEEPFVYGGWTFSGYKFLRAARGVAKGIGFKAELTVVSEVITSATYTVAIGDIAPPFEEITAPVDLFSFTLTNTDPSAVLLARQNTGHMIGQVVPNVIDFDCDRNGDNPAWIIGVPDSGDAATNDYTQLDWKIKYSANISASSQATTGVAFSAGGIAPYSTARPVTDEPMRVWPLESGNTLTVSLAANLLTNATTVVLEYREGGVVSWTRTGTGSGQTFYQGSPNVDQRYIVPIALTVRNDLEGDEWYYIRQFIMPKTESTINDAVIAWTYDQTTYTHWVGNAAGDVFVPYYFSSAGGSINQLVTNGGNFNTEPDRIQNILSPSQRWLENAERTRN